MLQTELEQLSENKVARYDEREQFESFYYSLVARARALLEPPPGSTSVTSSAASSDDAHAAGSGCRHDFVRLPKIDLPHFSGDYQHWLEFRDTYISLIHDNSSIQDINKFHYLRAALSGGASLVIKSLDFKADNYPIAWNLLSERYNNERLLVNNHVQVLFSLEQIQRESSGSLRHIIDVTNKNLRALDTLGQPTEHWDTLVIFMMSKKLDAVTNRQWEECKSHLQSLPNLKDFLKFLSNRADLLETLNECKFTNTTTTSTQVMTQLTRHQKTFLPQQRLNLTTIQKR